MRRICFLGNSHLAAVKLGLEQARAEGALAAVEVDTFGSHRSTLASCRIEDGALVPTEPGVARNFAWTSGGREKILLAAYDALYIVAGGSPFSVFRYLPAGQLPPPSLPVHRAVAASWCGEWAPTLGRAIAAAAPRLAVHFVGEPAPSTEWYRYRGFRAQFGGAAQPDPARLARLRAIQAVVAEAVAEAPHGMASVVAYPPSCLDALGVLTRAEFTRGAKRLVQGLEAAQPDSNDAHMNAAYGLELLRHLGLLRH